MEEVKDIIVDEVIDENEEIIEGTIVDETGAEIDVEEHNEFNNGKGEDEDE